MSKKTIFLILVTWCVLIINCFAGSVKWPDFGDQFYPSPRGNLSAMIDTFLENLSSGLPPGEIFLLISPHAGYGYSGQVAAFGYKLIEKTQYKTVIIIGTSHRKLFNGAALYGSGAFVTSLGQIEVDNEFLKQLEGKDVELFVDSSVFYKEHSVEVQLPFLQKTLSDFKIVPVVIGDCSLESCEKIAHLFKKAIGERKDVLVVVSTDLYHGYDFRQAEVMDNFTLSFIKQLDHRGLYYALREGKAQACGGMGAVISLYLAKELGYQKAEVLRYTNSAALAAKLVQGDWTVGYASCAVFSQKGEEMLNISQKTRLLEIARQAILMYLQTGKKLKLSEADPILNQKNGAFVTLKLKGKLKGCIGNLIASQPLYLTVRDMAIEAAVDDPRFSPLSLAELNELEIEISVLSPMEKISSTEKIELGKHGVLVRRGNRSGVFLPQVAGETGWSKEEFLDNLCAHKAGLSPGAWKDKDTQLYIFSAEVFSEPGGQN